MGNKYYDEWRGCSTKVRFNSYNKAMKQACKHGHAVYYCPFCGGYHLTSDVKEFKRGRHYPKKVLDKLKIK